MPTKVTFISGQSIEVPGHGWLKRGIEIVRECDDEILESPEHFEKFTSHYYEVADLTIQAALWKWVAAHPSPAKVGPLVRDRDDPSHRADRAIDEARDQREPQPAAAAYHNGNGTAANGNGNGYQKQNHNWNRGSGAPAGGQYGGGGNRGGGSYGPPKTGSQLFAWAKGEEETRDIRGFVKTLQKIAQEKYGTWQFRDLNRDDLVELYEQGKRLLEGGDESQY